MDAAKHPLIQKAIEIAGSQAELAKRSGFAQQHISKLLNREVAIRAETAVAVEKATGIPRHELRPDLWDAPTPAEPERVVG